MPKKIVAVLLITSILIIMMACISTPKTDNNLVQTEMVLQITQTSMVMRQVQTQESMNMLATQNAMQLTQTALAVPVTENADNPAQQPAAAAPVTENSAASPAQSAPDTAPQVAVAALATSFGSPEKWSNGVCDIACYFADVTGDGRADFISLDYDGFYVLPSDGNAFGAFSNWTGGPSGCDYRVLFCRCHRRRKSGLYRP